MKRIVGCILGIAFCGVTQLSAVTFIEGPKQSDGQKSGIIRYALPPYLSNLNAYHEASYQIAFIGSSNVNVESRMILEKATQSEVGGWNKGVGSFSGLGNKASAVSTLGMGNTAISFELVTTTDVRLMALYLSVYIDGQIIGGWLLNQEYWAPKVPTGLGMNLDKQRISILDDPSKPVIEGIFFDGKAVQEGDFITEMPLISADVRDEDEGVKSWKIMLISEKNGREVGSKEITETTVATQSFTVSMPITTPLEKGYYRAVVTVKDTGDRERVVTSNRVEYKAGFSMENLIVGPTPYNSNKGKLVLEYQLTQAADVKVYVVAIDGERQWEIQCVSGQDGGKAGFNRIEWDGKNAFGEDLANGMYVVYAEAKGNRKTSRRKTTFLVLK